MRLKISEMMYTTVVVNTAFICFATFMQHIVVALNMSL
jgi:hypothetical protein